MLQDYDMNSFEKILHTVKALFSSVGLIYFLWSWRGLFREGGLFPTHDKSFIQMVFCILSALLPLKSQCYQLRKFIYISQL